MSSLHAPLLVSEPQSVMAYACAGHRAGLSLIVLVAIIWVAASQLIETIFKDQSFDHPYFLTYFNTCGFSFWLLASTCRRRRRDAFVEQAGEGDSEAPEGGRWRKYGKIALVISPAWLLANYLFNLSLDSTSVASNSMFSTTSNLWTMIFSCCFLGERMNPLHVAAVALTMGGAALVATSDAKASESSGDDNNTYLGDSLALTSAFVYGAYTVMLKHYVPEKEEGLAMPTLFGFIGLFVMLGGWPIMVLLHLLGWEAFALPSRPVWGSLVVNALVGTNLSDVLWAYAVQLTTPLTATLGLSLTVPFGMISDVLLRGKEFDAQYICGSMLVLLGFFLVSVAQQVWSRLWITEESSCSDSEDE
ncbi:putative vacuolar membrane protein [Symbiodinium microadriaticum]|uniref:Putative vacuolar membrane protein n=1 Tax=Symbiodinium microadriaticum TaxID=2951 RepID=A0A1Q9DW32_SYMMI|nr:putative vacuolar membrane protein [Symbiodinium microadriaticum]